ncbi:glutathione S-transferase family protein [Marinomonas agarivorans]|nr:glutathione S-transferase family protein [Marinomonas agarivorans]
MNRQTIELISYKLCPYVQRSVITLLEKNIDFKRTDIDLAHKPDWFKQLSPTGKVPLLKLDNNQTIFESAVICEYLDEVTVGSLLPTSPEIRASHRSWIEYGSQTLAAIGRYYSAKDKTQFNEAEQQLRQRFETLEQVIVGPYFSGQDFMMVDAVYAPIFRYFDVFGTSITKHLFSGLYKISTWREYLNGRPSVIHAVDDTFPSALLEFVIKKNSYLGGLLQKQHTISAI